MTTQVLPGLKPKSCCIGKKGPKAQVFMVGSVGGEGVGCWCCFVFNYIFVPVIILNSCCNSVDGLVRKESHFSSLWAENSSRCVECRCQMKMETADQCFL